MAEPAKRFTIAEHVAWELVDDGSVMIMHLPTGDLIQMPSPADQLWLRVHEGTSVDELAALLRDLGATSEQAATEAQGFYAALAELDLLTDAAE